MKITGCDKMSPFNLAWSILKQYGAPDFIPEGGRPFNDVLNSFAQHPYYNHPENESYKELMGYLQEIKGQELTPGMDDDRRFLARTAHENAEHLDGVYQGLHDEDGNPL